MCTDMWNMFVPLIVGYCFPKGEGLRHRWLLSTIPSAIASWLGAFSRNHGRQAHRGGFMAGEVLRKSTRGRYTSATRTREKGNTRKTAHRALQRALGSPHDIQRCLHGSSWPTGATGATQLPCS